MKNIGILAGIAGGFFIELVMMWLTEKVLRRLLQFDGRKGKLAIFITARIVITLLVLTLAAIHSLAALLSIGAGLILYVYIYVIMDIYIANVK